MVDVMKVDMRLIRDERNVIRTYDAEAFISNFHKITPFSFTKKIFQGKLYENLSTYLDEVINLVVEDDDKDSLNMLKDRPFDSKCMTFDKIKIQFVTYVLCCKKLNFYIQQLNLNDLLTILIESFHEKTRVVYGNIMEKIYDDFIKKKLVCGSEDDINTIQFNEYFYIKYKELRLIDEVAETDTDKVGETDTGKVGETNTGEIGETDGGSKQNKRKSSRKRCARSVRRKTLRVQYGRKRRTRSVRRKALRVRYGHKRRTRSVRHLRQSHV